MTKKTWQKPTINQHQAGITNKHGGTHLKTFDSEIDGVAYKDLINQYGSPLFILSEKTLRNNARNLIRAFKSRYPKVIHGWSYKTNYLGAVCNVLHDEGSWAEVVSEFEYQKARSLGIPGKYIIFNGPHKERPILEQAVEEGAKIHIDHLDELYLLEQIAKEKQKTVPVTMRLNFNTGYTEPWSRFGFNIESGQALDVAKRIGTSEHLNLNGLHSHIGTFVLDPQAYAVQIQIMCNFMEAVEIQTGTTIESIDIGGGFGSRNSLQGTYLPPEQVVPTFDQYAEIICSALLQATESREANGKERPLLILESGRSVVDDAEVLASSVVANKRMPDGRKAVVMDAGVNLMFTSFWYNHNVRPIRQLSGIPEDVVLYGPLCMNIDVMRHHISLPPVNVGDVLVFGPVGAYNNTQWMQFIEYRPNVVMVRESGEVNLVRAAEDLSVMIAQERLPKDLQNTFKVDNA
ncbi:MAG: diaminopimelate decarboxylase [Gammaproteobacteria bacterium]|nr:MAG: diaminopimelate decarboxylase [Gammaproteobacteria bacterium]